MIAWSVDSLRDYGRLSIDVKCRAGSPHARARLRRGPSGAGGTWQLVEEEFALIDARVAGTGNPPAGV